MHKNIDYSFEIITYWINYFNKRFESQLSTLLYMTWLIIESSMIQKSTPKYSFELSSCSALRWGPGGFKGELASDYFLHTKVLIALNLRESIIESIIRISNFLKCPLGHIWWLSKPWMIQKSLLWTPSHMNIIMCKVSPLDFWSCVWDFIFIFLVLGGLLQVIGGMQSIFKQYQIIN